MKATRSMLVAVVSALLLGGCAYPRYGSADYGPYGVRGEQEVRFGVIESVRLENAGLARVLSSRLLSWRNADMVLVSSAVGPWPVSA